jgi:hypothetical protein
MKLWRFHKIECSILKYRVPPPLGPTYIDESRRTTFVYGIKGSCYEEHVGEHIGNLMGNLWELKRNIVGTHREPKKNETTSFPSQT